MYNKLLIFFSCFSRNCLDTYTLLSARPFFKCIRNMEIFYVRSLVLFSICFRQWWWWCCCCDDDGGIDLIKYDYGIRPMPNALKSFCAIQVPSMHSAKWDIYGDGINEMKEDGKCRNRKWIDEHVKMIKYRLIVSSHCRLFGFGLVNLFEFAINNHKKKKKKMHLL